MIFAFTKKLSIRSHVENGMDDIEYFNRRLKESDFVKRGFSPDQQVSGGFTENHFGRTFSPTLNFTIYYDQANGKLSMYSCDPSSDITSVVTHNHLWKVFVFSEQELDFLLNRCAEYQSAVNNTAWRLQRPPIAGEYYHDVSGSRWSGEQRPNDLLQVAIQHGLPIKGDLVWEGNRTPTVVFKYNPDGRFLFDQNFLPKVKSDSGE